MLPAMPLTVLSRFLHPDPRIRRELVDLLYTSLPQVMAISVTSVTGAVTLAVISGDRGYAVISFFILITASVRVVSLWRYKARAAQFSDADVVRWERIYGAGASAFGLALGALSFRALELGDAPGAWLAFGLCMSYCVGMVSRAAIRPWIILTTAGILLMPTLVAGLLRPELAYKIGAGMLVFFWLTLREASRHLSAAFIERLEAKHRLARQATHDFLTGLPNRAAFLQALTDVGGGFAIIAIDLDGFKPVNDRHGHHAGDDLLRQVAARLTSCAGADCTAARFGGDEIHAAEARGHRRGRAGRRAGAGAPSHSRTLDAVPAVGRSGPHRRQRRHSDQRQRSRGRLDVAAPGAGRPRALCGQARRRRRLGLVGRGFPKSNAARADIQVRRVG